MASLMAPCSPRRSGRLLSSPPTPATGHGAKADGIAVLAEDRDGSEGRARTLAGVVLEEAAHSCQEAQEECLEQGSTAGSGVLGVRSPMVDVAERAAGPGFLEEAVDVPESSQLPPAQGVEAIVDAPGHRALPPFSAVNVPSESIADLLEVYSFLRSFSQILFLSPFPLPEFVCSLCLKEANALIDAIHVSLLQMLRRHLDRISREDSHAAFVCLRICDWDFLDAVTWPSYMMAFLATHGVNKRGGYATVRSGLLEGEYYQLDVRKKIVILKILCDHVLEADETKAELEMRVNLLDTGADSLDAKSSFRRFRDPVSGRWCTDQRRRGNACLERDLVTLEKVVVNHKRETCGKGVNAEQQQPVFLPGEETDVPAVGDRSTEARDTNYDECVLCGMDGSLICCDGCPAAYHARCVGVSKVLLPEGNWFCPECMIERTRSRAMKACRGLRGAQVLGVDPQGRLYTAVYGYLLVFDSYCSSREYHLYDTSDLPRLLKFFHDCGPHYDATQAFVMQWWADLAESASLDSVARVSDRQTEWFDIPAALDDQIADDVPSPGLLDLGQPVSSTQTAGSHLHESWDEQTQEGHLSSGTTSQGAIGVTSTYVSRITETETGTSNPTVVIPQLEKQLGGTTKATLAGVVPGGGATEKSRLLAGFNLKRDSLGRFKSPRLQDVLLGDHSEVKDCSYTNQYALGEAAASAAASLAVLAGSDEQTETAGARKRSKGMNAADQIKAFSHAPAQFYWPHSRKKPAESRKERCGWCIPCRSSSRRGCLLNIVSGNLSAGVALVAGGLRPTKTGQNHLSALAAYVLYMEESLDGLLTGPWESNDHRRQWRKRIELAESCNTVKIAVLQMESRLRLVTLSTDWTKQAEDAPSYFSWSGNSQNSETITPKRGRSGRHGGVNAWKSKFSSCASPDFGFYWRRGGKLSRQLIRWERLPSSSARRVGRQGGLKEVPELIYTEGQETARRTLRCAWQARLEMAMNVSQVAVQVRQLDKYIRWTDLTAPEACDLSDSSQKKVILESEIGCGGARAYLLQTVTGREESLHSAKKKDVRCTTKAQDSAAISEEASPTQETRASGCFEKWMSEWEVPLHLIKDFEATAQAQRRAKLNKPARRVQVKSAKTLKRGAFWARICAPLPPQEPHVKRTSVSKYGRKKASVLVSRRQLLLPDRKFTNCQVCKAVCDQASIPGALNLSAEYQEMICENCLQLRLGKRRRKPTYKMLQLLDEVGLVPNKNPGSDVRDFAGSQLPATDRGSTLDMDKQRQGRIGQSEKQEGSSFRQDNPSAQVDVSCCALNGLTVIDDLSRKAKLTAKHQAFRRQRIVLPGQLRCDPSMGPRCYVCWKEYNPAFIYVGCGFCHEWFHGDSLGVTEELVAGLVGFKCCKCRKVCSPACPLGQSVRRQRSRKYRARLNLDLAEGFRVETSRRWADNGVSGQMGKRTCAVCASHEVDPNTTCRICGMHVHEKCYFLKDPVVPTSSDWACDACNAGIAPGSGSCCFCPLKGGALKQTIDGCWIHSVCGLWNQANVSDTGDLFGSTSGILMHRKSLECCFCRQKDGACIKCSAPGCRNKYFHPLCCRNADLPLLAEHNGSFFVAYCQRHAGLAAKNQV